MKTQAILCIPLCLLLLAGCGHGNPLGRVDISGKITLDGKPLPDGNIRFLPQQSGGVQTGAVIDSGGEYHIEKLQGLPPGKYRVQIFSSEKPKGAPAVVAAPAGLPPPSIERIPPQYNLASTLVVEVPATDSARFDFQLQTK